MRGLEKNCMKKGTKSQTDGHRDSMKESAKGRFFEKVWKWLEMVMTMMIMMMMSQILPSSLMLCVCYLKNEALPIRSGNVNGMLKKILWDIWEVMKVTYGQFGLFSIGIFSFVVCGGGSCIGGLSFINFLVVVGMGICVI